MLSESSLGHSSVWWFRTNRIKWLGKWARIKLCTKAHKLLSQPVWVKLASVQLELDPFLQTDEILGQPQLFLLSFLWLQNVLSGPFISHAWIYHFVYSWPLQAPSSECLSVVRQKVYNLIILKMYTRFHSIAIGKPEDMCASFALWQQATTEFMRRNHSVVACSRHIYVVLLFAHIPFVVNHTFNVTPTERLQQFHSGLAPNLKCLATPNWNACEVTFANANHKNFPQFVWRALVPPTVKKVPAYMLSLQHLAVNFKLVYVTFDNLNAKAFENESRRSLILKNAESWVSKTRSLSDVNITKNSQSTPDNSSKEPFESTHRYCEGVAEIVTQCPRLSSFKCFCSKKTPNTSFLR